MHTTPFRRLLPLLVLGLVLALPTAALAHGGHGSNPRGIDLHVGDAYDDCYFDLHPELTAEELREFANEGGLMARFRQTTSADTLGAGTFDLSLVYAYYFLDDSKGAWNNTMSHPHENHYLGEELAIPALALGLGVTDDVDVELYGTANPNSNYGVVGVATKVRLFEQSGDMPVSLSVRQSFGGLVGPAEILAINSSTDIAVSRSFYGLAPFVGVSVSSTLVIESSDDTAVGHQAASTGVAFAGLDYRWRFLSVGAEAEISELPSFAFRASGRF